ncbi:MAG: hypothetical protein Q7J24_01880 [Desulfomicrobium sp.]|nr:hypothetical protein [Desulfomicrobium sp.]
MRNPAESQDETPDQPQKVYTYQDPSHDDPDVIFEPPRLTRYDKARAKLTGLLAKRDALAANPALSDKDAQRIVKLNLSIDLAEKAVKRAQDAHQQRLDEIDRWRAGEGADEYNAKRRAKRRTVRAHPNADLSNLSEAEKAQYEKDRRSDANWFKRQRDKSVSEDIITAAYAVRIHEREAKRAAKAQADDAEAEMRANPIYGRY